MFGICMDNVENNQFRYEYPHQKSEGGSSSLGFLVLVKVLGILKPAEQSEENFKKGLG